LGTELDSVDIKLLKMLQEDGRISFKEMGEKIGMSTSGAKRRIENLKKRGVIKGFTVEVDEGKMGYPVTALLNIHTRPDKAPQVAKDLSNYEEIEEVNRMFQNPEIIAEVHAETMDQVDELKRELAKSRSIGDVEAKIVQEKLKGKPRV